jgi:hypothetical protein
MTSEGPIRASRLAARVALAALVALSASGCVRQFAAFDDYRVTRYGEPVAVRAAGNDAVQTVKTPFGVVQAIPVQISRDGTTKWQDLAQQVWADRRGAQPGTGRKNFYLLGADTLDRRATVVERRPSRRYLFPVAESNRIAALDYDWERDAPFADLAESAMTLDEYQALDSTWSPASSPFFLVGVDAVALRTDSGSRVVPSDSLPADWFGFGESHPTRSPLPGKILLLKSGFAGMGVDSVRIFGNWYRWDRRSDRALWRVRALRDVEPITARRDAPLQYFTDQAAKTGELDMALRGMEGRFLQTLDATSTDVRRVLVACWDSAAPDRPCFAARRDYTLVVTVPRPEDPSRPFDTVYPFRVQRRSWPVSFIVGTGLIFVFLGASAY